MALRMRIRKDQLPADPTTRAIRLREYFCDKDAVLIDSGEDWLIKLKWTDDAYRYIDPRLNKGLRWWEPGISYAEMATARRRQGRVLYTLYDTWTLESWSHWLSNTTRSSNTPTILHIDDHRDIDSPRLFLNSDGLYDPITDHKVDLMLPTSVTQAIESGAIGMGSFLTPFLHKVPNADVRHLCQAPKCMGTQDFHFLTCTRPDDLLNLHAIRPAIDLIPSSAGASPGGYRYTNSLVDWLEGICDGPILLHIDLDYFCNRYDGDSDALVTPKPLNPPLSVIKARIDALGRAMQDAGVLEQIDDIVIAFSPGFFPAELWGVVSSYLMAALGEESCLPR